MFECNRIARRVGGLWKDWKEESFAGLRNQFSLPLKSSLNVLWNLKRSYFKTSKIIKNQ